MTTYEWSTRHGAVLLHAPAAIALAVVLAIAPTLALAAAQVRGKPDAVSVEAQNASVEEILVVLTKAFNVRFRSSANLDRRLTGRYEGSLQQVVAHILRGYDFFVRSGETGLEITLLGSGKAIALVGASPESKAAERGPDIAAEPSSASSVAERPVPVAASGGPSPTIKLAKGPPAAPIAAPPPSGSAPSPVPATGLAAAPSPAPPAPGSAQSPVPSPRPSTMLPPPTAAATPSAPSAAR